MCNACGCESGSSARTPADEATDGEGRAVTSTLTVARAAADPGQFRWTGQRAPGEGELTTVDVEGHRIAVARAEGAVYAFDDTCTHLQCSLSTGELEGRTIVCPCHQGTFDIATGEVLDGPPPAPVRTWPVRVVDGVVEIGQ